MKKQNGFTIVEGVIIVVVIAIAGVVGYVAWNKFAAKDDNTASVSTKTTSTKTSEEQEATPIKSSADLDKATSTLNSTSLDDSDATAAENQADF